MAPPTSRPSVCPAAWPLRSLELAEFERLLLGLRPRELEISKEFVEARSIKTIAALLRRHPPRLVSFAGTTDFCSLSGMDEREYLSYFAIQATQAAFLGSHLFRVLAGDDSGIAAAQLRDRLSRAQALLGPIELVVETHGGRESDLDVLRHLLDVGRFRLVVDIANVRQPDTVEFLLDEELGDRIAYFHVRNLDRYIEDESALALERALALKYPDHLVFFEPKRIDGAAALEVGLRSGSVSLGEPG